MNKKFFILTSLFAGGASWAGCGAQQHLLQERLKGSTQLFYADHLPKESRNLFAKWIKRGTKGYEPSSCNLRDGDTCACNVQKDETILSFDSKSDDARTIIENVKTVK